MSARHHESKIKRPGAFIAINDEVLNQMASAIVQEVAPEKIVLFGSNAKDSSTPKSDVDLLVVKREPFGKACSRIAELSRIRSALRKFYIPKDVLLYSEADLARLQAFPGHIVHECLREGRVLYERPRPGFPILKPPFLLLRRTPTPIENCNRPASRSRP